MALPCIAVLGGTGQPGRGLAQRFALAGFPVVVGARNAERAASTVAAWPAGARPAATTDYRAAIARAEVIVLAVPFGSIDDVIEPHREAFKSQSLVVDVTVPVTVADGAL